MHDDALEKHDAVVLEYGHSVGHALEMASHGRIPHGLAIGIGMIVEATISNKLGLLSRADLNAHYELLQKNGAPTSIPPAYGVEELLEIMEKDNKRGYLPFVPGSYDIVLLKQLGDPNKSGRTIITQVGEPVVRDALEASFA
jgi:3-dehydroquinate synthase/2-deoxy-scyllo-inosose synthase